MPSQPAQRVYRTWVVDSTRWDRYRPRPEDVVIATYPKCGTTWMQRIVDLLVFQTPEPRSMSSVLSRRAETLEVPRPRTGAKPVHLLVDSTGLKLCGPGEWLVEKHGTKGRRSGANSISR